jgi:hypothetical protein
VTSAKSEAAAAVRIGAGLALRKRNEQLARPVVLAMPLDLMRHDMLMTYEPIPPARVLEIVHDLFMPLVAIDGGRSFKG